MLLYLLSIKKKAKKMKFNDALNNFEVWLLKRIAKKAVKQSFDHEKNIKLYYKIISDAAREEFKEDNKLSLDGFLKDAHNESLKN